MTIAEQRPDGEAKRRVRPDPRLRIRRVSRVHERRPGQCYNARTVQSFAARGGFWRDEQVRAERTAIRNCLVNPPSDR